MTKTPTPTEQSKKQRDNIKKNWFKTDLIFWGRMVILLHSIFTMADA